MEPMVNTGPFTVTCRECGAQALLPEDRPLPGWSYVPDLDYLDEFYCNAHAPSNAVGVR